MLISKMQPVQEAYFGKTPNLVKCEKILDKLIKKNGWDKASEFDFDTDTYSKTHLQTLFKSEFHEIEKLFVKEFGFRTCSFLYLAINPANMGQLGCKSIIGRLLLDNNLDYRLPNSQKDGKYYDTHHCSDCVIVIFGPIISCGMTGAELLAIMLHEVGHAFQCTPMCIANEIIPSIQAFQNVSSMKELFKRLMADRQINQFVARIWTTSLQFLKKTDYEDAKNDTHGIIAAAYSEFLRVFTLVQLNAGILLNYKWWSKDIRNFRDIALRFSNNYINLLNPAGWTAQKLGNYSSEVFADSFAAAYGYGPEMVSALGKMDKILGKSVIFESRDCPIWFIFEALRVINQIADEIVDEHPQTVTRMTNIIDKLERDLASSDLPPNLKKKTLNDLARAKKVYNTYLDDPEGENSLSIRYWFSFIQGKLFGGYFELRNIVNKLVNFGFYEA